MAEIFRRLFKMSFHPPQDDNSYETLVYPVYNIFFDFFNMNSNIINFKSSTGSGKTRCAPFMFSILSYYEELKMPFFIMTQPGKTIIDDKVEDFTNFFGDTVILETDPKKYLEYYKQQNITKPIIGLFSPRSLLVLISKSFKKHIKIFDRTRFCLDEIHERDCHTDAVISELAENCPKYKIKKHIMMMSATPDNRIFDVFREDGIEIKELHLKEKCLFPIKDVIVKVDNVNNIATTAVNNAIQIIDNMTTNTSIQGHILIFSSGRQRILEIYDLFLSSIKEFISNEKKREEEKRREFNEKRKGKKKKQKEQTPEFLFQKVGILLDCEEALNDEQKFYQYIKENVTDKNKLYILPIPFLSYVSNFQKHIAKSNIPNYDNIIKVVIATNAIESSITIDNMAAVIDCGICNTPEFNSLTGIINLKESQITKQNQMQRRGRVGRVMPGTAVQITVEGEIIPDYQEPEILTSDISAFILDLRRIGIRFENLKKLPNEVPLETVQSKINILKNIGALDLTTGNLTKKGLKLSS
ncbi:ATP-dependent RNA helicase protein, partial [Trichomonas vaginalis G3]|uniref:ATP-dependent RNA helicase protein n=1 Tax=Trichomonas vaginalis (strain ATCC PRA-98 / G3) TaxID=412133 RepID=UPI0021E5F361